jgi:hypothetical protein
MIFKNIFAKKTGDFCCQFLKIWITTLVFEKNGNFSPKIGKNRRKFGS